MIAPNQTVEYYKLGKPCGWHVGSVVEIGKHLITIQPATPGKKRVKVPVSDVREVVQ